MRVRSASGGLSVGEPLDDVGAPVGVQQKLMRHAQVATTMNTYGNAQMKSKRMANTKVVQMILPAKEGLAAAV